MSNSSSSELVVDRFPLSASGLEHRERGKLDLALSLLLRKPLVDLEYLDLYGFIDPVFFSVCGHQLHLVRGNGLYPFQILFFLPISQSNVHLSKAWIVEKCRVEGQLRLDNLSVGVCGVCEIVGTISSLSQRTRHL